MSGSIREGSPGRWGEQREINERLSPLIGVDSAGEGPFTLLRDSITEPSKQPINLQ